MYVRESDDQWATPPVCSCCGKVQQYPYSIERETCGPNEEHRFSYSLYNFICQECGQLNVREGNGTHQADDEEIKL